MPRPKSPPARPHRHRPSQLAIVALLATCLLGPSCAPAPAPSQATEIEREQITFGPKNHFFGYIGHVGTVPWNQSGRYIVALRTEFVDRMPGPADAAEAPPVVAKPKRTFLGPLLTFGIGGLALLGLGAVAPPSFMAHFTVFVLACFVGYMVIWNVTPALHTPLMSVTNAISSIIIIGALIQISSPLNWIAWVAGLTVFITSINIAGGFAVTRRMLDMFRK